MLTSPEDPYGTQRNYFHSFIPLVIIMAIFYLVGLKEGIIFSFGYLSHLILDMIDGSDFYPLFPITRYNFKGPIGYFSKREIGFTILLFTVFIII